MSTTTDNTVLNPGVSGDIIRDVIKDSGAKTQVIAVDLGGAGPESLLNQSNVMPVRDQELLEALDHEANNIEQRTLTDILSKLSDNFEAIPVELQGPGGRPFSQDTNSGGMVVNIANKQFDGTISATTGPGAYLLVPCSGYLYYHFTAFTGAGSAPSLNVDAYINGAWTNTTLTAASTNATPSNNLAMSATAVSQYSVSLSGLELIRIRGTAITAGNPLQIKGVLSNIPYTPMNLTVSGSLTTVSSVTAAAVAGTVANGSTPGTQNPVVVAGVGGSISSVLRNRITGEGATFVSGGTGFVMPNNPSVTSGARTTSSNLAFNGESVTNAYNINVTAASGATPTLDLVLQETYDNNGSTSWVDLWHMERITAATSINTPPIVHNAAIQRRWVWTIGGTTPSFTFEIRNSYHGIDSFPIVRKFFDRTAGLLSGTLNAVSATFNVAGCSELTASVTIGAATTGGTYKLQLSPDGTNFYDASAAVVAVANSTVAIPKTAGIIGTYARVICSSAATAQTGTHVSINGNQ